MLAARLGALPLALKIVGSYLAGSADIPAAFAEPGSIGTYLDYLHALDGDGAGTPAASGDLTPAQARALIGRTWDLTLQRLDGRQMPEARQLLRLLASLADAPIPYELLLRPAELAKSQIFGEITGTRLWQAITALDDVASSTSPAATRLRTGSA